MLEEDSANPKVRDNEVGKQESTNAVGKMLESSTNNGIDDEDGATGTEINEIEIMAKK